MVELIAEEIAVRFVVRVLRIVCQASAKRLLKNQIIPSMKSLIPGMKKLSVSVRAEHVDLLDEREEESRSGALRGVLDEYEDLHTECEELRTRCERLENEKRTVIENREEHDELVRYVEEERTAEQRRREAGLIKRARWWAFGMPADEADG